MKLDFLKICIKEVLRISSHPMISGHYAIRHKKRACDGFLCVCEGSATYTFDNYSFRVKKGDVFYLAYQSQYDIDVFDNYYVTYVDCVLDAPSNVLFESQLFENVDGENLCLIMHKKSMEWLPNNAECRLNLLSFMYSMFSILAIKESKSYLSTSNRMKLERAKDIIVQSSKDKDFSCAKLGERIGLSEVHFRRIFTQMYSMTPRELLTYIRIRSAKELLKHGDMAINSISETVGFNSVYYFCKVFKRETNCTPSEYRHTHFDKKT